VAKPPKKQEKPAELLVAQNRAASYNYHLLEKHEAGMVLLGTEVKSLREGKANLRDAYAGIRAGAVWLLNCHIAEYLPGGPFNHKPLRPRKLLLHSQEIEKLDRRTDTKGLTLVPLRIYFQLSQKRYFLNAIRIIIKLLVILSLYINRYYLNFHI